MPRSIASLLCAVLALASAGCRSPRALYVHPNADLGSVRTVAVLPFENVSGERLAADKVQKLFVAELLAASAFQIVEPGLVQKALRNERVDSAAQLTADDMKKVAAALGAEALFLGSVLEWSETRGASVAAPRIVIQLRLVEAASGATLWSITDGRSGASFSERLFGVGGDTPEEAAQKLLKRELKTLLR